LHNPPALSEIEQRLQQLTNAVLAGKADEVRQSTYAALARGASSNDVLDAMTEAVNIIVDLHDVGEYDSDRLIPAENAIMSCLQVLEDRLVASQGRFNTKATVGPLGLKAGGLLSLAMCAALRSVGFEATNLSKTQTPLDLLRNSEELRAELVIPLLARDDVNAQLDRLLTEIERGGFKTKFEIIPVASGRQERKEYPLHIAENPSEAISKATEWALRKATAHRSIGPP
jgi:methanogenic corrinoid protein MtbC1